MRIVHSEASCGWGGQEIRILEESKGMIDRGHEVRILCPAESRIFSEAPRWKVPVVALPIGRKNLKGMLAMRRWLQCHEVDILNTHSSTDSWLGAIACATLQKAPPIVRTRHISAPIPNNWPTRWLYTKATRHIVTTGEALRQELIERNGYPGKMISSIPTGIDPVRFAPGDKHKTRQMLGLDAECRYLGIVATLRSWKGHLYLIDAFAALYSTDWKLVIVGDGPMRDEIKRRIDECGVTSQAILTGQRNDPEDWLRALDIFCLPSYANEGVPQALIQAMMCELPVVTTNVGAIPELVDSGLNGLVVEPRSTEALARALGDLMTDADRRTALGHAARQKAMANYSCATMLSRMESLFEQTRGHKRP